MTETQWLGLVIGNSRLHWAAFEKDRLQMTWHTPHLQPPQVAALIDQNFAPAYWPILSNAPAQLTLDQPPALWIAAVVPAQAVLWQPYEQAVFVRRDRLPLSNYYSTLGIDRGLALTGAMVRYGDPMLVIDGGTALTFTAGVAQRFTGGAILPGLRLQLQALAQGTAALPEIANWPQHLPQRWATETETAMQSGIAYTVLAGIKSYIQDWEKHHPNGHVVITGGDRDRLYQWLIQSYPPLAQRLTTDPHLMFFGLQHYRSQLESQNPQLEQ